MSNADLESTLFGKSKLYKVQMKEVGVRGVTFFSGQSTFWWKMKQKIELIDGV